MGCFETLTPQVVIVGAGPSGSVAAAELAKKNVDVLLVDKAEFPREKPCGDIISSIAVSEMRKIGVWEAVDAARFRTINGIRYYSPNGTFLETSILAHGWQKNLVAPRFQFDSILRDYATECGAKFRNCTVSDLIIEDGRVAGVLAHDDNKKYELRGTVTIAADGANSVIASKLLKQKYPDSHRAVSLRAYVSTSVEQDHTIQIYFLRQCLPGYGWAFPVQPNLVNMGIGIRLDIYKRLKKNLFSLFEEFLRSRQITLGLGDWNIVQKQSWFVNFGSYYHRRTFPGIILVGDAGGYANPVTGAGIGTALTTARYAAATVYEALNEYHDHVLSRYDSLCRNNLQARFVIANFIQRSILSHPWLVERLFQFAVSNPKTFKKLLRISPKMA